MNCVIILSLLIIALANSEKDPDWESYKKKFPKSFCSVETENNHKNAYKNAKNIKDSHNELYNKNEVTYLMEENEFFDLPPEKLKKITSSRMNPNRVLPKTCKAQYQNKAGDENSVEPVFRTTIPTSLNWNLTKGMVAPAQNQGDCGSCYAFSAIASLEGIWFKTYGASYILSKQQIIDCSYAYGNDGCTGGLESFTFDYLKNNGGINANKIYPIIGGEGSCKYNSTLSVASIKDYKNLRSMNETALMELLATVGPVAVGYDASPIEFSYYGSGVYYSNTCGNTLDSITHSLLLVGYGITPQGLEYWIVKNSWGRSWGMLGFAYLARNKNNNCAIATDVLYPLV